MVQDPIFGVHHAQIYQRQFLGVNKKKKKNYDIPVLGDAASCIIPRGKEMLTRSYLPVLIRPFLLVHLRRPIGPSSTSIATSPILPYPDLPFTDNQPFVNQSGSLLFERPCRLADRALSLFPPNLPNQAHRDRLGRNIIIK